MPPVTPPLSLSVAASLEKSKLASADAWLALVKLTWPDSTVLRLVRNVDSVVYDCGDGAGAQTYEAFSWEFGELQEQTDGSIPTWTVKVSNVQRIVEALIEQYGGGVGGSISIYIVQASRLKREPDLELDFDIVGSGSDAKLVTFKLGAESPFRILFGRHPYSADTCIWRYQSVQCGYVGSVTAAATTAGSASLTLAAGTGITTPTAWGNIFIAPGSLVTGAGIPAGTFVGTISGATVTLVNASGAPVTATATAAAASLTFLLPVCSYRLNGPLGCRAHNNQLRFGAHPGIDSNGLKAVEK